MVNLHCPVSEFGACVDCSSIACSLSLCLSLSFAVSHGSQKKRYQFQDQSQQKPQTKSLSRNSFSTTTTTIHKIKNTTTKIKEICFGAQKAKNVVTPLLHTDQQQLLFLSSLLLLLLLLGPRPSCMLVSWDVSSFCRF